MTKINPNKKLQSDNVPLVNQVIEKREATNEDLSNEQSARIEDITKKAEQVDQLGEFLFNEIASRIQGIRVSVDPEHEPDLRIALERLFGPQVSNEITGDMYLEVLQYIQDATLLDAEQSQEIVDWEALTGLDQRC